MTARSMNTRNQKNSCIRHVSVFLLDYKEDGDGTCAAVLRCRDIVCTLNMNLFQKGSKLPYLQVYPLSAKVESKDIFKEFMALNHVFFDTPEDASKKWYHSSSSHIYTTNNPYPSMMCTKNTLSHIFTTSQKQSAQPHPSPPACSYS